MKKRLVAAGCIGAIMLASIPPQAMADVEPVVYTQKITSRGPLPLLERIQAFKRMDIEIITIRPWLNPEMRKFSFSNKEMTTILRRAGFEGHGLKVALRIVWLESTNRPYALNRSSNCYGLFQINMTGSMGPDRRKKYGLKSNKDLFDPLINAKIAYHMSNGGKDWSAWTTENTAKATAR